MNHHKKLFIVIEDTDEMGFNCYLSGDVENIPGKTDDQLSPAEFWGINLFNVCVNALHQGGVVVGDFTKPNGLKGLH